jgi:hypothetical protein
MEIYDISVRLKELANTKVLRDEYRPACLQAASLLRKFRAKVLDPKQSDSVIVEQLRQLLVQQGEG